MPSRIVVFGATGYTGRLTAERLVALGERPVLAGRSESRLAELAGRLGGLEHRTSPTSTGRTRSRALVEPGDVLLSTVGPFKRWGEPAVRAAIAAGAIYIDSTGEPAFIRRVFEEHDAPARRAGATLLTAMGYDFVPGALAGALALEEAGRGAVRVDVGYYALGGGPAALSRGTRASLVGVSLDPGVRVPRRARHRRALGRADPLVRGPRQGPPRDLGRRRRALHAAGRLPAPARGQRVPRLVRRPRARRAGGLARERAGHEAARARAARSSAAGRSSPAWATRRRPGTTPGTHSYIAAAAYDARRRAARRGARVGRRRLRLHRRLPGLGGAARRRARASSRPARPARSRRSGSPRSSRAAPRPGSPGPERRRAGAGRPSVGLDAVRRYRRITRLVLVAAGLPKSAIRTASSNRTVRLPRAPRTSLRMSGLRRLEHHGRRVRAVAADAPARRPCGGRASRLRAVAAETVQARGAAHGAGARHPDREAAAGEAASRPPREAMLPRRNVAGVSIAGGRSAGGALPDGVVEPGGVRPDLEVDRLLGLDVARGVDRADLDRVRARARHRERPRLVRAGASSDEVLHPDVAVLHQVRAAVVLQADVALRELAQRRRRIAAAGRLDPGRVLELVDHVAVAEDPCSAGRRPRPRSRSTRRRRSARRSRRGPGSRSCRSTPSSAARRPCRRRAGSRGRSRSRPTPGRSPRCRSCAQASGRWSTGVRGSGKRTNAPPLEQPAVGAALAELELQPEVPVRLDRVPQHPQARRSA